MELATLLLALPLGIVVGLSLGMLGAGGSILTVPALVLVLGLGTQEAAATSLVVVGSTALAGAVAHRRRGAARLRAAAVFAGAGIGASLLASLVSLRLDPDLVGLGFAAVMLVAAAFMWRRRAETAGDDVRAHGLATRVLRTAAAGSLVGALTGFFGIGGGFLAVPGLVWALGLAMPVAVGTSLLVIAGNAAVALVPRVADGLIDLPVTLAFAAGGIVGVALGTTLAHRTDPSRLRRGFAVVIGATAVLLAASYLMG